MEWLLTLFPGSSAVEQTTVNRLAGGSNPSRGAINLQLIDYLNCINKIYYEHLDILAVYIQFQKYS